VNALDGIRVLDIATVFAGPMAAAHLGDFGADVIKVEHPRGDSSRHHGQQVDGVALWWKLAGRNKRTVTLDLSKADGQELFRRLAATSDVIIENFRPGTLERWNLSPASLREADPRLIVLRVSGFGQFGPYAQRAGFGTLAEAMSGFAHVNGFPDGPPTLPTLGVADAIAGISGAFAVMNALFHRERTGDGQVIDLALIEPMLHLMGPQAALYDRLGVIQQRVGNRSIASAPRNVYRTGDEKWVAISCSALPVAERVMRLIGRPDLVDQPWFATGGGRVAHADELDEVVGGWIGARPYDEVVAAFTEARAAIAPIYDISDVVKDPQYQALGSFARVGDDELGDVLLPNVLFRMGSTPGSVRWAGRPLGADNDSIYRDIGVEPSELSRLAEEGTI
jgi:crotonobetainyl-CoA:carnitine CoA-transferase CaiB-like acyl-CoA transferase